MEYHKGPHVMPKQTGGCQGGGEGKKIVKGANGWGRPWDDYAAALCGFQTQFCTQAMTMDAGHDKAGRSKRMCELQAIKFTP